MDNLTIGKETETAEARTWFSKYKEAGSPRYDRARRSVTMHGLPTQLKHQGVMVIPPSMTLAQKNISKPQGEDSTKNENVKV